MSDALTMQTWVATLKNSRPSLPNSLTLELELELLGRLDNWFARIKKKRLELDSIQTPPDLQNELGRKQIIPVLLTLDETTPDEQEAINDLFICLSAFLARKAHHYWRAHSSKSLTFDDVLSYLPIVFTYVLSAYNPDVVIKKHKEDFVNTTNRVRLITWVGWEARRHINSYLQMHAATVRLPVGHFHRLRHYVLHYQNEFYVKNGREPKESEILDHIRETNFNKFGDNPNLTQLVASAVEGADHVSLFEPNQAGLTYEDILESDAFSAIDDIDWNRILENRLKESSEQTKAASLKLVSISTDKLTFNERYYLR